MSIFLGQAFAVMGDIFGLPIVTGPFVLFTFIEISP